MTKDTRTRYDISSMLRFFIDFSGYDHMVEEHEDHGGGALMMGFL